MARQMVDIGLDSDGDLAIVSGDSIMAESTPQHQQQLILNNKGDFKQNPVSCVGAFDYLDDENFTELIRAISIEFAKDGMDVLGVTTTQGGIIASDAFYK